MWDVVEILAGVIVGAISTYFITKKHFKNSGKIENEANDGCIKLE